MNTKTTSIIVIIVSIGLILAGLALQNQMPETVATHWNEAGEADGFGSRTAGIFLLPAMMIATVLLLVIIPQIDPLRKNIFQFRPYYNNFILAFAFFFAYLHVLTLLWNIGVKINFNQYLIPGFGIFFYFAGILISKAQRNYMIGIRTPWTLANDEVWERTHTLGGKLFKASGLIAILGVFFPSQVIWFMLVPILGSTAVSLVYSYVIYRQIKPQGEA